MPNRKIALNFSGVRWVAENAAIGVGERQPGQDRDRDGEHDRAASAAAPNSDDDDR